jgi:hypothetical protein
VFDSTYCVAVLQHVSDLAAAVREFARVTRAGGRVLAVEPDNAAQYWYSSTPSGAAAYAARNAFFGAVAGASRDHTESSVGPRLPTLFAAHGIEPLSLRLFPVAQAQLGAPAGGVWATRERRIRREMELVPTEPVQAAGRAYLEALARYAADAEQAGPAFVEIQNTTLFATVGQRSE